MFRRITIFAVLFSVSLAGATTNVHAGCGGGRRFSPSFRPALRFAQPRVQTIVRPVVHVQRPTVIHQPIVHNVVRPVLRTVAAPLPPRPQLPTVPAGSTMTLPSNFLGTAQGDVFMVFNNIKLPIKIQRWEPTGVTITLPPMAIKTAVEIQVDIVLPNGRLAASRRIRVTKPASVVLHPTAPTSPLPTQDAIQTQNGPRQQPVPTQPVAIAPLAMQPQTPPAVQPQVGQPIILPNGPDAEPQSQVLETNPILQEHVDRPAEVNLPGQPVAPTPSSNPFAAISKLIGG